jgi:hypothetical protein
MLLGMNKREPEMPTRFTADELDLLESRLKSWLEQVALARQYADKRGELWIFKAPSLQRALKAFTSFIGAVNHSLDCAAAGRPIAEQTSKSRKPLDFSLAAEQKGKYKKNE